MADDERADQDVSLDPNANLFEGLKKKKKKKKVVGFTEEAPPVAEEAPPVVPEPVAVERVPEEAEAPVFEKSDEVIQPTANDEEDTTALFENLKKKKKSKKPKESVEEVIPTEEGEPAGAEAATDSFDAQFEKKKKISKKKPNLADFEKSLQDDAQVDFGKDNDEPAVLMPSDAWIGSDRDYSYEELLSRIYSKMPSELRGNVIRIVPPQVVREGTRKTVFANVVDVAKSMHRTPEHVIQFLHTELSTHGSIDGSQRLVIKGVFKPKQIESVLKRYIAEYVACRTCKSPNTILTKENRLFFVQCESCGSSRTVTAIKQGFQAQTTKRSKIKAAGQ